MKNRKKTGVIVLAIVGLFVFGFGVWSIGYRIKSPFFLQKVSSIDLLSQENVYTDTDTDLDGLTDFDETNFYKTSPYLEDTDSDGISDSKEIANGTDPNCPEGKECQVNNLSDTESTVPNFSALTPPDVGKELTGLEDNPLVNTDGTIKNNLSAKEIRDILKVLGVPNNALSKMTDQDVMSLYKQTLQEIQ